MTNALKHVLTTTLFFKEGSSDKVYQCSILEKGDGFVVDFAFGRRGSTFQTGTKTASPIPYDKARAIFDKLVKEKEAKGYTPGEDGTPYKATDKEERATGVFPQLLNPVDEDEAKRLINDDNFLAQEKYDGKRMMLRLDSSGKVTAINRKGLECGFPAEFGVEVAAIGRECLIDGEAVGETFHAFDILEADGKDLRHLPYTRRHAELSYLLVSPRLAHIRLVQSAATVIEKADLLKVVEGKNREGVVFKRKDAAYKAGRPASGGSQFKFKLVASATCLVAKVNGSKRSVALQLSDGGKMVDVGNCTITPNHEVPRPGAVVEVRYLYANRGGSLYQPVYAGERDDVGADACVLSQLKYKGTEEDDDA
jgi:bifunctional non-homologous end joining protein LigD